MTNIFTRTKNKIYDFDGRSEKNKRIDYFIAYTVVFAILCLAVFIFYWFFGRSFVQEHDGIGQHYNSLVYFGEWVRQIFDNLFAGKGLQIPVWDFGIGYGGDVITTLNYYVIGDPLDLLTIFVPAKYTIYLYNALVILRLYLAGVAFSCFCFRMKCKRSSAFIGTFSYVFCGYAIVAGLLHPFFLNPMIYFPLILIGAERILHKERPTLFIIMIFISALSNFYFFYMLVLLAVLYVLFRFFMLYKEHRVKNFAACFAKFLGYGAVGVMISAITLLPILIAYTGDARSAVSIMIDPFYEWDYYTRFLNYFISGAQEAGRYTILGYTPIVLLSVFLLFKKKKKNTALKIGFILLTIMLFMPFFGSLLNGMGYVTNRWVWAYSFICAFILVKMWNELLNVSKGEAVFLTVSSFIYVVLCVLLSKGTVKIVTAVSFVILAISALSILALTVSKQFCGKKVSLCLKSGTLFLMTLISIFVGAASKYPSFSGNYTNDFLYTEDAYEILTQTKDVAVKQAMRDSGDDKEFSRMSMYGNYKLNTTLQTGLSSTQFYWSIGNGNISEFMKDLDLLRNGNFYYYNLDERAYLQALASVKYYVVNHYNKIAVIPYGYEKVGTYYVNEDYVKEKIEDEENKLGRELTDKEIEKIRKANDQIFDIYKSELTLPLGYSILNILQKRNLTLCRQRIDRRRCYKRSCWKVRLKALAKLSSNSTTLPKTMKCSAERV